MNDSLGERAAEFFDTMRHVARVFGDAVENGRHWVQATRDTEEGGAEILIRIYPPGVKPSPEEGEADILARLPTRKASATRESSPLNNT